MHKKEMRRIKWYVTRNKYRKIWNQFVRIVACFVVFCTTYALILPAITLEKETFCAIEDHEHTDACYEPVPSGPQEKKTPVLHTHNEFCRDANGQVICPLAELTEHQHTEVCYETLTVEPEEAGSLEETPTVPEETEAAEIHTHDASCYVHERGELRCEVPESAGHRHEEACYVVGTEPVCQQSEEDGHTHADDCYQKELVCQQEEAEGHTHSDVCYDLIDKLVCELDTQPQELPGTGETTEATEETESQETVPTVKTVLVCGKEELTAHTHNESCVGTDTEGTWAVVCGKQEIQRHQHTLECLCFTEEQRICNQEESESHQHTYLCYECWEFVCQKDTSEDSAAILEVETAEDWEQTFADVVLTGVWPEDVLHIAQTQIGYAESTTNQILSEDETIRGYTRYGEWWGTPYADWDALFVSFCLHYAGVDEYPVSNNCDQWMEDLTGYSLYLEPDRYIPKPGDLIFLDFDQKEYEEGEEEMPVDADRVGLVAELIAPTDTEPARIKTIEADADDQVSYLTYELDAPVIIGYGYLPEAPADTYSCGMVSHSHGWMCYDEEDTQICGWQEHTHDASCKAVSLHYSDDVLQLELKIRGNHPIPEDLCVTVVPVTKEEDAPSYGAMFSAVGDAMLHSPYFVNDAVFYRIELWSDGQQYQLPEGVDTEISVSLAQSVISPETLPENMHLRAFALQEDTPTEIPEEEEVPETAETVAQEAAVPMMLMAVAEDLEEEQEDTAAEFAPAASYQALETRAISRENAESGISELSFSGDNISTFGIALAATTQEGNFWRRVTSSAELTSDGIYMIVSAEGNYALSSGNPNGMKVYVDTVKGNTEYYVITDVNGNAVASNAVRWTFSGSNASFTVKNVANNSYFVDLSNSVIRQEGSTGGWWPQMITADALTMTYLSAEHGWRLTDDNRTLTNGGSTSFTNDRNNTSLTSSMLIFKLVNTTLTIPDDVVTAPEAGSDGERPVKPDYDPYRPVTGGLTGDTSHAEVAGTYYSDPATSQLETHFTGDQRENGMVHTDKSVIYGDDDYDAFDSYDANTFGVTLSALGQEFLVAERETIETPVDIVFILDVSGSMHSNTVDSRGTTRAEAMVEAVNFSIAEIMDQNPNNRVAAVLYSSGTGNLLEMGRYEEANGNYLELRDGSWRTSGGHTMSGDFVYPNDTLYKDGELYSGTDTYPYQHNGTYTQAGIAQGAQKLLSTSDTTCDVTVFAGTENETTVKVQRQPVFILLSDGEPTHCTSNYKDVLNGPHYGDGQASPPTNNAPAYKGVYGYYTILSANYYKRMVGIHYNTPALFYSVGMGISSNGDEGEANVDGAVYKRAVLNPTAANVSQNSSINATNTTTQMRNLLNNAFNGEYITVTTGSQTYMPSWMGNVHADVPVLKNPYSGNYSYANNAYFGNYNAESLKGIFGDILEVSKTISPFGFILRSRTSMDMTDPIGENMELKSDPILRYGGRNYTHTRKEMSADGKTVNYYFDYLYTATDGSAQTADLSKIIIQVITDENGLQTVHMNVPDYILPAYSPYAEAVDEETLEPYFYYEALPLRLIYQVGLTEEAQAEVAELKDYGGELVYYTNRHEGTLANAYLLPTNDNPYYAIEDDGSVDDHHGCHSNSKGTNVTGTISYSFECHHGEIDHMENGQMVKVPSITQKLGNNGKLRFVAERKVIDIPVEKKWYNSSDENGNWDIEIQLYSVKGDTAELVETLILNKENQWEGIFDRLPLLEEGGFYALREVVPEGFVASYSGEVIELTLEGKPTRVVKIQGQDPIVEELVTVTNSGAYVLPSTGGMGTQYHTFGGLLLMAAAAWMYIYQNGKQRKKGGTCGK